MSGLGVPSTFEKARRKKAVRRVAATLKGDDTRELLPLEEVTRRLRMFEQTYLGIRTIPVDRIIGTVDRATDFDREFLPRRPGIAQRWRRVEQTYPEGDFPPVAVYEVDGSYFLVDGHHRVAIARQRRIEYVDAEVTRLRTRFHLPPDADIGRIIYTEQQGLFMDESGLERACPEARVEFTHPRGYVELLDQIKVHGYHLMREQGRVLAPDEVAEDWYDRVYLPTVEAIRQEGLHELFRGATDADLFLLLSERRQWAFPERGGMPLEDVARLVKEDELRRRRRRARARQAISKLKPRAKDTGRRAARGTSRS